MGHAEMFLESNQFAYLTEKPNIYESMSPPD